LTEWNPNRILPRYALGIHDLRNKLVIAGLLQWWILVGTASLYGRDQPVAASTFRHHSALTMMCLGQA
jgi:hypothetical protein